MPSATLLTHQNFTTRHDMHLKLRSDLDGWIDLPLPAYSGLIMHPALHRGPCRCEHINRIYSHTKYIHALHAYYVLAKSSPETSGAGNPWNICKGFHVCTHGAISPPFLSSEIMGRCESTSFFELSGESQRPAPPSPFSAAGECHSGSACNPATSIALCGHVL